MDDLTQPHALFLIIDSTFGDGIIQCVPILIGNTVGNMLLRLHITSGLCNRLDMVASLQWHEFVQFVESKGSVFVQH